MKTSLVCHCIVRENFSGGLSWNIKVLGISELDNVLLHSTQPISLICEYEVVDVKVGGLRIIANALRLLVHVASVCKNFES